MPGTTSSRPKRRLTSARMQVHAQEESFPSGLRSKRVCRLSRLGIVSTTCRWATGAQIFLGHMQRGQQGAFLVAGGTGTALLAGKGHEHLVVAVGAANPRKAFFQIATFEKGSHAPIDHRSPEAVLGLKSLVIDLAERLKMLIHQPPQIGSTRITWPIHGQRFGACKRHDQAAHRRRRAHGARVEHRAPKLVVGRSSSAGQQRGNIHP